MKRYLASAAAVAFLASSGLAYAAGTFEGEIVGIDHQRQMIMLDTGQEFVVSQQDLARLQPGDRVVLTYPEPHVATAPGVGVDTAPAAGLPAEAGTVEGEIAGIDMERHMIRMDTGEVFTAPERDIVQLRPGDRVVVNYEVRDGQAFAHSVIIPGGDERASPGTAPGAAPQTAVETGGVADPDAAARAGEPTPEAQQ